MEKKEKIKNYFNICQSALKSHDWTIDINDYVVEKEKMSAIDTNDFIDNLNPWQISEIQLEEMILTQPADIDFYNISSKDSFYYNVLAAIEFKGDAETLAKVEAKIKKISTDSFLNNYIPLLSFGNVICELKKENFLNNNTFFKLYQFMEYISNKYSFFSREYDDPYSFYALMVLFFMDLKNFSFNFEKGEFETKKDESAGIVETII